MPSINTLLGHYPFFLLVMAFLLLPSAWGADGHLVLLAGYRTLNALMSPLPDRAIDVAALGHIELPRIGRGGQVHVFHQPLTSVRLLLHDRRPSKSLIRRFKRPAGRSPGRPTGPRR